MEKFAAPDHQNMLKDHCLKYAYCEKDEKTGLKIYKLGDCPPGTFFDTKSGQCGAAFRFPISCDGYEVCKKFEDDQPIRRWNMTCGMLSSLKNMVYVGPGGKLKLYWIINFGNFNLIIKTFKLIFRTLR